MTGVYQRSGGRHSIINDFNKNYCIGYKHKCLLNYTLLVMIIPSLEKIKAQKGQKSCDEDREYSILTHNYSIEVQRLGTKDAAFQSSSHLDCKL